MQFQSGTGLPAQAKVDVLAFTVTGNPEKDTLFRDLNKQLGGLLVDVAAAESFDGKNGQVLSVVTAGRLPAGRVLVIGMDPRKDNAPNLLRDIAATVVSAAQKCGAKSVGYVLPKLGDGDAIVHMATGVLLGAYKFDKYLTSDDAKKKAGVKSILYWMDAAGKKRTPAQLKSAEKQIERAEIIAAAICRARDLVNEPAAFCTPSHLAATAEAIAKAQPRVTCKVLGPKQCEELGMGMFLAVAQGSDQEPRFIHMTYKPAQKAKKVVALIGKGLTFDSGGYSIKPSQSMEDMKVDMAGSAAVISAMEAIARLGCPYEVHVVAACCENMVSGHAYRLGDVLKSMDGTTVEINNTDAEGRLTLGDAITYVRTKIKPDEMFDFATLTGACMVALGPYTAGVMSDNDALCKRWLAAADRSGEDMWRLPLNARLKEQLKSPIADMKNTGDRFGGAITAGLFLKVFAKDTPWVHVDIAGPASLSSARPWQSKGGSGFAVATIVEYLAHA